MIVTDGAETPRWMCELERFRHIKNLLFLHGNVLDLVTFADDSQGTPDWIFGYSIDGFLRRFLTERGYANVDVLNPVSGLETTAADLDDAETSAWRENSTATNEAGNHDSRALQHPSPRASRRARTGRANIGTAIDRIASAMLDRDSPSAYVIHLASRLMASPGNPTEREHDLLARLLKASLHGVTAYGPNGKLNNLIILICDKLNDFPPWLYVDNPRARAIQVDKPDRAARERFLVQNYPLFHGTQADSPVPKHDLTSRFGFVTDGLGNYELQSLLTLSTSEQIPIQPLDTLVSRYKFGIRTSEWDSPKLRERLAEAEAIVRRRVKGQDVAVARVVDLVKRAWLGLAAGDSGGSHRPRGVLFFAGPTGVGKTEMAKALAEVLFGSEDRMLRFDMSEYAAEHADQRLLGSPPGYVGYEEGGQLTTQVKEKPFSVLLFDEIEKAHPRIFDKFLQILDDGRLTDGKGDTVYFSESVVIFTSNLGSASLERPNANTLASTRMAGKDGAQSNAGVDPSMPYADVRDQILGAIRQHFNDRLGRPEILNRFGDNFVVFDFIKPPLHAEIVGHMIERLCSAMQKVHRIALTVSPEARSTLERLSEAQLDYGGRGIRNIVDRALVDPLARWLFDQKAAGLAAVQITEISDHGDEAARRFSIEAEGTGADSGAEQIVPKDAENHGPG